MPAGRRTDPRRHDMSIYLKKAKERPVEDLTRVRETVREIIDRVRREGEAGVRFYSSRFDNWSPASFKVGAAEIKAVKSRLPAAMVADIDFCQTQIRRFASEQMKRLSDFEVETRPGVFLGQKVIPVASSGAYVPGGR
ncbi:MAG: histidinol dehydrogenase, partial [Desulfobacteraceae bacterium]